MIKRIVEISSAAHLAFRDNQLVIRRREESSESRENLVSLEDLGVLIVDSQEVTYTQRLILECAIQNVALLICDLRHLPTAFLLPFEGNHLHSKTIRDQTVVRLPIKKRIWQTIVRAKIQQQADLLEALQCGGSALQLLIQKVKSGDQTNIEAQAARMYWPKLFGAAFRRDREESGINGLLNYGYAVLRAAVARAIVGTGLYPAFGIKHSNQYNTLCLADDLMEPLRPLVDQVVYGVEVETVELPDETPRSTKEKRHAVLQFLMSNLLFSDRVIPLIPAIQLYAASFKEALLSGEPQSLTIPRINFQRRVP
jgi:CRISPR-associated protein Cas1